MFQTKDINIWRPDFLFFCFDVWLPYRERQAPYMEVRHFSLPYTGLAWLYMEVRHQNILQQGGSESVKIISSNVNIFCLEHFYTI